MTEFWEQFNQIQRYAFFQGGDCVNKVPISTGQHIEFDAAEELVGDMDREISTLRQQLVGSDQDAEVVAWEASAPSGKRLFHDKAKAEMSAEVYGGGARPLVYGDTQPQPAVPEGWKLVPIEPTGDMEEAGCQGYMEADGNWHMHRSSMGHAYRAMIECAPTTPQVDGSESVAMSRGIAIALAHINPASTEYNDIVNAQGDYETLLKHVEDYDREHLLRAAFAHLEEDEAKRLLDIYRPSSLVDEDFNDD